MSHLTYSEAGFVGLLQGIAELFQSPAWGTPRSSRRSSGAQWARDLNVSKQNIDQSLLVRNHGLPRGRMLRWIL